MQDFGWLTVQPPERQDTTRAFRDSGFNLKLLLHSAASVLNWHEAIGAIVEASYPV